LDSLFPDYRDIHTIVFDFDGVFTDNRVFVDQEGRELVCCNRGDGLAFDFIRFFIGKESLNLKSFVLSKEPNKVVLARCNKLGLDCHHGVSNKLDFLERYVVENFGSKDGFDGLVYLGNDLNDLPAMCMAGFSVAPSDAHPRVKAVASLVLESQGGSGFVREFVERFLQIDKLSEVELYELVSNC